MVRESLRKITSTVGKYLRPNLTPITEGAIVLSLLAYFTSSTFLKDAFLVLPVFIYLADRMLYDGHLPLPHESYIESAMGSKEKVKERRRELLQIPYYKALMFELP